MRVLFPAFAVTVATLSLSAQTSSPASNPPVARASPAATSPAATSLGAMSTYHSDALRLSYLYPAAYKDASTTVGPAFEASMSQENLGSKDTMRCVTLPFSAMNSGAGQFSMVLLVRADGGCLKKSFSAAQLPEFTRGEVQGLIASGAHTQFGEPVAFTSQGHPAELLQGTFELPTAQPLHALVVCMLLKPDIACWQFLASSDENLHAMTAFPVALDGAQPAPLVPATVLAKP